MAGAVKRSTRIVGLKVASQPRETLLNLYSKTLSALALLPSDATYRKHAEQITTERMKLVEEEKDVKALESKINCGQIEEVILQAKDELALSQKIGEWKSYEPLQYEAPAGQWDWP